MYKKQSSVQRFMWVYIVFHWFFLLHHEIIISGYNLFCLHSWVIFWLAYSSTLIAIFFLSSLEVIVCCLLVSTVDMKQCALESQNIILQVTYYNVKNYKMSNISIASSRTPTDIMWCMGRMQHSLTVFFLEILELIIIRKQSNQFRMWNIFSGQLTWSLQMIQCHEKPRTVVRML